MDFVASLPKSARILHHQRFDSACYAGCRACPEGHRREPMMPSNGLKNSARSKPALLALSAVEGLALPALSRAEGSAIEGSGAEVEPRCGRERSKSPQAKSRAQPRDRERSRTACPERSEKNPFLIATRAYSHGELTRWKQRASTLSNRGKIHSQNAAFLLPIPRLNRL